MIIITGAAGFIGSCIAAEFNRTSDHKLLLVDDFSKKHKDRNLQVLGGVERMDRKVLLDQIHNLNEVEAVLHIGARTDTTEFDKRIFDELNLEYSKVIWNYCASRNIPMIYASSAATYGDGAHGYVDDHEIVNKLKPLNPYGDSKNDFDAWALKQSDSPSHWYGLKFFNVYGPNEYHKGRMASVIMHAYTQIREKGSMKLFRSHKDGYRDGEQLRDFVYVKDVVSVIRFLLNQKPNSGLYNLGTGKARTFLSLAQSVFSALDLKPAIEFIDTPIDIRDKYQYFTEADMSKLINAGYSKSFTSLENGISDYVINYLAEDASF